MADKIQAIRGMNDVLPDKTPQYRHVERQFIDCLLQYGYQEIRFPTLENTQLFKRTIGEVTDIVEKEMYTFADVNGDSITLRPEGTASCVRACLEHGLLHNQQQKLWYIGPMFRHERPQKGRYRQFTQLGVEAFGMDDANIELELIAMCYRMWQSLGIATEVKLQINTLGTLEERVAYKELLVSYFKANYESLDADSKNRLLKNPLRILDSKNPEMASLITNAPKLLDTLGADSKNHFDAFCQGLDVLNIAYEINPVLVRGLDYYGHTVFEWVTDKLGSQATVCAGGRYDILVEQLGGSPTPAVGFALGIERVILLMEALELFVNIPQQTAVFLMTADKAALPQVLKLAESIRCMNNNLQVLTNTNGGSFKSQFKKADKSGARLALILGEEELAGQFLSVKDLRNDVAQMTIKFDELNQFLKNYLGD